MRPIRILLLASLALAACRSTENKPPALKTWEEARFSQLFKMVDADQSGEVTPEEFRRNYVPVTWQYFDKDGSGYIDANEWALDGTTEERAIWFQTLDANRDGRVSRDEFQYAESEERVHAYFVLMDRDQNGVVTKSDLERG